jgi:hypothetical protein
MPFSGKWLELEMMLSDRNQTKNVKCCMLHILSHGAGVLVVVNMVGVFYTHVQK